MSTEFASSIEDDGSLIILSRESSEAMGFTEELDGFVEIKNNPEQKSDGSELDELTLNLLLNGQKQNLEAFKLANQRMKDIISSIPSSTTLNSLEVANEIIEIIENPPNDAQAQTVVVEHCFTIPREGSNLNDLAPDNFPALNSDASSAAVSMNEAEKKPIETEKEPIETEKEPIETEKEPIETEKEPIETEKEPIETEKRPTEKSSKETEITALPVGEDLKNSDDRINDGKITTNQIPKFPVQRRRKQLQKQKWTGANMQNFIQDYYRSLDKVHRYIIFTSIISFCTAFALLSCYSSQTHQHDMEIFKMKEDQAQTQQSVLLKSETQSVSFRESIIHQRYEEARECRNSLKTCHSGKDELLAKITKLGNEATMLKLKLESELDKKELEIQRLQERNRVLQAKNQELRSEVSESFTSSFSQIMLGLINVLRNRTVQIAIGTFIGVSVLLLLGCAAFSK